MPKIPDVDSIDNPFLRLWNLGYRRLCSVVPPDAELNARSRLYKRSLIPGKDPRGKAPGRRWPDGKWTGYDFTTYEPSLEDMTTWASWNASVGVKTGRGLVALDIDTKHKETARELYRLAVDMLGEAPIRFGNRPKSLMLYGLTEDMPYDKVVFSTPEEERACVEILGEGRQFVAHGVHPITGQPYTWDRPVLPRPHLPEITPAQLRAYLDAVEERMPAAQRFTAGSEARATVEQEKLRAPLEIISEAVKALPNRTDDFPDREDFIRVGYAIKAACGPEHEQEAIDLYHQWCGRWDEGYNDPEAVEEEWARMKPPFGIGAGWLFDKAEALGGWEGRAKLYFEPVPGSEPPPRAGDTPKPLVAGTYTWADLDDISPREWLYGKKIIRKFVTLIASPGGVGKTAWTIAAALSCATGEALLHDKPIRPLNVWLYNLEDPADEVKRRLKAAILHLGLPREVVERIYVNSGRDRDICVLREDRQGNLLVQADYGLLRDEMLRRKIDIFIADPFLRTHRVPENATEAQDAVMKLFAQLGHETNAGIVLVHHFRKGGQGGDAEALRGSSTQTGGARQVYTLSPMAPEEAEKAGVTEGQRLRHIRIDDAKRNMSPPMEHAEWIRLDSYNLGNGTPEYPEGDDVQVATAYALPEAFAGMDEGDRCEIIDAIDAGPGEGDRYSARPQDARWAGHMLMADHGRTRGQAIEMLRVWTAENLIEVREFRNKDRKTRKGLFVNRVVANESSSGLFD